MMGYFVLALVVGAAAWVASRVLRDRQFSKLAQKAGAGGAYNEVLTKMAEAEERRAVARRRRWSRERLRKWAARGSAPPD